MGVKILAGIPLTLPSESLVVIKMNGFVVTRFSQFFNGTKVLTMEFHRKYLDSRLNLFGLFGTAEIFPSPAGSKLKTIADCLLQKFHRQR
jgi:hypothetical protein